MTPEIRVNADTHTCVAIALNAIAFYGANNIKRAIVQRNNGMILYTYQDRPLIHCSGLSCGFSDGTGPRGSIEVLQAAGFPGDIQALVFTQQVVTLSK